MPGSESRYGHSPSCNIARSPKVDVSSLAVAGVVTSALVRHPSCYSPMALDGELNLVVQCCMFVSILVKVLTRLLSIWVCFLTQNTSQIIKDHYCQYLWSQTSHCSSLLFCHTGTQAQILLNRQFVFRRSTLDFRGFCQGEILSP